ncbi:hypothetical protein [Herbidospora cretacea]|uniref:hypothetical protein n=1 Tax=Herbidospora cretacea TaxID=28444 RepID=UPI000AA264C0|nr:hypothetical protein [Herbidospora cretacea]
MSLLRTITKPIREAYNHRDEITQKVKDLPMLALQGALSGVGQAILLGDRVRTSLKRATGGSADEPAVDTSRPGVKSVSDIVVEGEDRPRREPVIFAPRPKDDKPEPVIFQPGGSGPKGDRLVASGAKTEPAAPGPEETRGAVPTTEKNAPSTAGETEATTSPVTSLPATGDSPAPARRATDPVEPAPVKPAADDSASSDSKGSAEDEVAETATHPATDPDATPEATESAKAEQEDKPAPSPAQAEKAAEPQGQRTTEPSSDPSLAGEPAVPSKIPPTPKPAKKTPGVPVADEAVEEIPAGHVEEPPARDLPPEPIAGYAELTFASLRARMRGRSAAEIQSWLDYEKASTARAEVIRMFENRLAKLES